MRWATAIQACCSSSESQRGAAAAAVRAERAAMPQAYEASGFHLQIDFKVEVKDTNFNLEVISPWRSS
jgi:hypothetical protein